jgi:hypothetical protein
MAGEAMVTSPVLFTLIKTLEHQQVLKRGEITRQLRDFEDSLRDVKSDFAESIREMRKRLER